MEVGKKGVRKWGRGWVSRRIFERDILFHVPVYLGKRKSQRKVFFFLRFIVCISFA